MQKSFCNLLVIENFEKVLEDFIIGAKNCIGSSVSVCSIQVENIFPSGRKVNSSLSTLKDQLYVFYAQFPVFPLTSIL